MPDREFHQGGFAVWGEVILVLRLIQEMQHASRHQLVSIADSVEALTGHPVSDHQARRRRDSDGGAGCQNPSHAGPD
jgi:hypothetical protein